ncbi:hypothetical protein MY4824_005150 [Beauveria thailandica]
MAGALYTLLVKVTALDAAARSGWVTRRGFGGGSEGDTGKVCQGGN